MDLETYGRDLTAVLAERSLDLLRHTTVDDIRRVMGGEPPTVAESAVPAPRPMGVGVAVGSFAFGVALGAGLTAVCTPASGAVVRAALGERARDAGRIAMQLGAELRDRVAEAGTSVVDGIERASAERRVPARAARARKAKASNDRPAPAKRPSAGPAAER